MRKQTPYEADIIRQESSTGKDGQQYARGLIAQAQAVHIPIEEDPEIVRETVDLDLGAQVPPQVYAVVAGVMNLLRKLEENHERENQQGHRNGATSRNSQ